MKRTLFVLVCTAVSAIAQPPQFPQHSTGMPSVLPPPIQNHITGLSGSIAGRPMPVRPGARPIYPAPIYLGGWGGWYPQPQIQPTPVYLVNQQTVLPPPQAPALVLNPDYKQEVAKPVLTEYSNIRNPYENFTPDAPKVYLLALKDGTLRQAVAFWAEAKTLHFVQPDHKQDKISFGDLDRESTKRFNSERGLEIKLPE